MNGSLGPPIHSWMKVALCHVVLWAVTSACANTGITKTWNMTDLHNPQKDIDKCGRRGKASWVCDPAKLLCEKEGDDIDALIKQIREMTGCPCESCGPDEKGYKVAVAIVPKILSGGESAETKAQIGRRWAEYYRNITVIGTCGGDIILVWSLADHVAWIFPGSTVAEQYLYTKCINNIVHAAEGYTCSAAVAPGVRWLLEEIRNVFQGLRCNFLDLGWVKIVLPTGVAIVLYIIALLCYAYHNWSEKRQKIIRRRDGIA